jgi:hypothetical protein
MRSIGTSRQRDCTIGSTHEIGGWVKCANLTVGLRRVQMAVVGTLASLSPWSVGSFLLCVIHIACEHGQALKLIPYATS